VPATNTPLPPTATNTPLPPTATPASANFALSFDGGDDVVVLSAVTGTGPLTVEAWVRPASSNADGLLVVQATDTAGWSLEIDGGRLSFWLSTNLGWQMAQHPTALAAGTWYHVAGTYAGGQAQTFVNGVAGPAVAVGTLTQGSPLRFGGLPGYPYFSGQLDEVRLSNVIRYTASFAVPTAPFVPDASTRGLWSFNEGSGQTVADRSGNANTGTLGSTTGVEAADPTWGAGYPFP
jgi:hypothetical protein